MTFCPSRELFARRSRSASPGPGNRAASCNQDNWLTHLTSTFGIGPGNAIHKSARRWGASMEQAQRSWLSLVTFCAVTGLLVALGSAVILAGASLAFAAAQPAAGADAN